MKMPKPTEADKVLFKDVFGDLPDAQVKAMFGNLAAFVNGNMFAGLFGSEIGLRLSDADREALAAVDGAGPFGPPDRPMKAYVTVPAAWRSASNPDLAAWVAKALDHTAAMAPKVAKPR